MEPEQTPTHITTVSQSFAVPFAIVIAGLAIAGAIYFGDNKKGALPAVAAGDTKANTAAIDPVTPADHILGNPNANIVIVEYSDTEGPFCKSFHGTMNRVMGEYGNGGKVAWVYRHFPLPFHSKAPKEAEATECANKLGGNTKFWEYTNKIFEITQGNNQLDPAELPKIAKTVGLDVDAFNKCLTSGEMKAIVDANIASGNKAGVRGTPHSIILVDKKVVTSIDGAQPYESVKATIDGLLK